MPHGWSCSRAFALAHVLVRVLASRVWQHRGEVVADWPIAQLSVGVAPWLVSLWAEAPTRYWLWAAGLVGASVALTVEASSEAEWTSRLGSMAAGSFVLLLALWALAVRRSCGVPLLGFGVLAPRFALPLHCVSTGALGALAASLGGAVEHVEEQLPAGMRWLMCGSVAVFLSVGLVAGVVSGRGARWALGAGGPVVVVPVLLGAFAGRGSPSVLVWALVAVARWPWLYEKVFTRRTRQGTAPT
ncbi:hypothetical protein [Streptomyces tanashiensis]|uniref:hypothetical protein n=1 Tax=Streptomyces tanashiensis TaxID=67367 RepID=UPI003433F02E